jgi:hypothetical protein
MSTNITGSAIFLRFEIQAIKTSKAQTEAAAVAKEGMIRMLQGDPKLCEMLIPSFGVGCRRLVMDLCIQTRLIYSSTGRQFVFIDLIHT